MQPAQMSQKLSFDDPQTETELAKEYINKHNGKFCSPHMDICMLNPLENEYEVNRRGNIIYLQGDHLKKFPYLEGNKCSMESMNLMAKKLQDNADLFAQLEFHIREIPQKYIKNYDIPLMVEYFKYFYLTAPETIESKNDWCAIAVTYNTPLCILGMAAYQLSCGFQVDIICDGSTAIISILFAELLYEAGFYKDCLTVTVTRGDIADMSRYMCYGRAFNTTAPAVWGAGVITEQADVRSALATLLNATTNCVYPWRLQRIFVQENIYKRVQSVLIEIISLKTDSKLNSTEKQIFEKYKKSAAAYVYNKNIILIDYTGVPEEIEWDYSFIPLILVEAYRTTKDLLSLMNGKSCNYLSLWCNDLSTSNEIAMGTDASNIWINDFGIFDGTTAIVPSFYRGFDFLWPPCHQLEEKKKIILDALENTRKNWENVNIEKRRHIIIDVLKKCKETHNDYAELLDQLVKEVKMWQPYSSVKIENGKICLQLSQPLGICAVYEVSVTATSEILPIVIKATLTGNVIIINNESTDDFFDIINFFDESDVPIKNLNLYDKEILRSLCNNRCIIKMYLDDIKDDKHVFYKVKVIRAHYGETFAN